MMREHPLDDCQRVVHTMADILIALAQFVHAVAIGATMFSAVRFLLILQARVVVKNM
jgi:hypothetical protein